MSKAKAKSRLSIVLEELKKDKKSTLSISWVNRKNEHKMRMVRVAGIAYDGKGGIIVVLRDATNPRMLFNLPLGRIVNISKGSVSAK